MAQKSKTTHGRIYTIGYEGWELDDFIAHLAEAGVQHVADVRARPGSHKKGFSKTPLGAALGAAGIGYSNWRELGTSPETRQAYHETGDAKAFFAAYAQELAAHEAPLDELAALTREQPVALLCFESDPATCHRSACAAALAKRTGAEVVDL